jgi:hypothetical protein
MDMFAVPMPGEIGTTYWTTNRVVVSKSFFDHEEGAFAPEHMAAWKYTGSVGEMQHVWIASVFVGKDSHLIETYSALEMKIVKLAWVLQKSVLEVWPVGLSGSRAGISRFLVE